MEHASEAVSAQLDLLTQRYRTVRKPVADAKLKPVTRSLAWLKAQGWHAGRVDRDVRQGPTIRSFDWLGFIDIVAVHPEHGVLAVQTTSRGEMSRRITKIAGIDPAVIGAVRKAGVAIHVHGWDKFHAEPKVEDLS